ncbi:MAG: hypothetical protein NTZ87_04305 [Candidatus Nomurabacteria bacterium]|nr:hypothetical protein [Candidatus Nomurabacteria bacterium]
MSTKKITFLLLIVSLVGFGLGCILKNSTELSLCMVSEPTCINNLTWIGNGFFYGMSALSLVFFVLIFTQKAFPAWKKFAIWFVPLATLLFIFYPNPGSGDLFSPYPEQVFKWVSILYVVISVLIIAFNSKKQSTLVK